MKDIGIDLKFRDNAVIRGWQEQINLTRQLVTNIDRVQREMNQSSTRMSTQMRSIHTETQKTSGSMGGLLSMARGFAAFEVLRQVAQYTIGAGKAAVQAAGEYEQLNIAFTTMLGSASQAKTLLAELEEFSKKTPFSLDQANQTARSLLVSGVSTADLIPTMTRLGDVAAGTGKNFNELAIIYGQVRQSGRLMGQDLLQFINAGVPLVSELAKNFKTSESNIKKMVSEGRVGFKDVQQAIKTMTDEGGQFGGLMEKQSESLLGKIEALKDGFAKLGRQMGEKMLPEIKEGVDNLSEALGSIDLDTVFAYFAPLKEQLLPALEELLNAAIKIFKAITGFDDSDDVLKGVNQNFTDIVDLLTVAVKIVAVLADKISYLLKPVGALVSGFRELTHILSTGLVGSLISSKGGETSKEIQEQALLQVQSAEIRQKGLEARSGGASKFAKIQAKRKADEEAAEAAKKRREELEKLIVAKKKEITTTLEQIEAQRAQIAIDNEYDPIEKANLIYANETKQIDALKARIEELVRITKVKIDINSLLADAYADAERKRAFAIKMAQIEASKLEKEIQTNSLTNITEAEKKINDAQKAADEKRKNDIIAQYEYISKEREIAFKNEIKDIEEHGKKTGELEATTARKKAEAEKIYQESILRTYILKRKSEDPKYSPDNDPFVLEMEDRIEAAGKAIAEASKKETSAAKALNEWKQEILKSLHITDDQLKEIESAYSQLFGKIVSGWQETTKAEIEANKQHQENLQKRRENAQTELELELEAAKLGYANNVELKQKEIAEIDARQRAAAAEGLSLKKKQAAQELIISETQIGVKLLEGVATTIAEGAKFFPYGFIIALAQVAAMIATFTSYRSRIKSMQSTGLYTGGRPVDYLSPGESPKRDAPGHGPGHKIDGTSLVVGAYEMIMNEESTNANLAFLREMNKGTFDNVDLMAWASMMAGLTDPSSFALPDMRKIGKKVGKAADAKEQALVNLRIEKALGKQTLDLIKYFENKPERLSHNGKLYEYKGKSIKITKSHDNQSN